MLKRRPSPTAVIACLALFFAVAGGSALALQGRNSVDSGDLKRNAVKTADIARNAVTSPKVRNGQIRGADLRDGSVGRADVGTGAVGPEEIVDPEAVHVVGAGGEPGFLEGGDGDCRWNALPDLGSGGIPLAPVSFYKDNEGEVHLSGVAVVGDGTGGDGTCDGGDPADGIAFILPPAYRPDRNHVYVTGDVLTPVVVIGKTAVGSPPNFLPAGSVLMFNVSAPRTMPLDGVTFRATGTGSGLSRSDAASRADADLSGVPLP